MTSTELIPAAARRTLHNVARDLHHRYQGVFGARQRLDALIQAESPAGGRAPTVLFLCVHNAGRSQMALGYFLQRAEGRALAWSAGSQPVSEINPAVAAVMAEIGIDIAGEFPKPWTAEFLDAADVVVTMGCGDSCPLVPGKHYACAPAKTAMTPRTPLPTMATTTPLRNARSQRAARTRTASCHK